ncbi:Band 4.1 protein 2 [Fasciola gigantica]|uniref:Band 4.1 protein 2 n=1 Tax=Fasciola gigantica TaxID=46835 RepID=A0A504YEE9_FASGI|nr:Band 4.1 protein 2 [Fasciola gigantica]
MTYCLLGAYIVQSEAGDHDPTQHEGIKYIQDHPFAPHMLQTPEMLERIVQLHKLHRGKTPEEADRLFLNNARLLALYGVDLHKVKNSQDEDINLGVYHDGILQYRNRIRLMRISWPRIISLSHKGRNFVIALRPGDNEPFGRNMTFKCSNTAFAKRLYTVCVEHHAFFRLRGSARPKKPSLFPSFASRKYHYPSNVLHSPTLYPAGNGAARTLSKFRPIPAHPNDTSWFTLAARTDGDLHMNEAMASQYQYQPSMMPGELNTLSPMYMDGQQLMNGHSMPGTQGAQRALPPGVAAGTGATVVGGVPHSRPCFEPESWRISPADRTSGLGIDARGLDVAAQRGAGWQGCRSNKGVKAPGAYYFEAACLEDGLVRVGWSTNEASLELGTDNCGFGFGADMTGSSTGGGAGRAMHRNNGHDYGVLVQQGDVVGCLLDLDKGSVAWSVNGKVFQRAFTIPDQLRGESFLPAASLKDSRLLFNFGDQTLEFHPGGPFTPVAVASEDSQVANRNTGWRLNPYDTSAGMDVAPDGSMAQAQFNQGWQGCRANQGIRGPGRFYFEVVPLEDCGLCRVGWSTEEASLDLGSDRFGFGYGADSQGFGLNGQQGKRIHADEIDNYGEAFTKNDVIGCFLDTIEHTLKWSKNGIDFGDAYRIPAEFSNPTSLVAFFPSVSLLNSTVEINFGDKPFQFYPGPDWTPVCCAPMDYVKRTRRKGPERKVKGWSYIDPSVLEPAILQQMKLGHAAAAIGAARAVERREEDFMRARTHTASADSHEPTSIATGVSVTTSSTSPHTAQPRQLPPGAVAMPGLAMSPISSKIQNGHTSTINNTAPAKPSTTGIKNFRDSGAASLAGGESGSTNTKTIGSSGIKMTDSFALPPVHTNLPAVSSTPTSQSPNGSGVEAPPSTTNATSSTPIFELRDYPRRVLNGETVSVERSEPQVETESFYDENGKLIRRTIKRSEVTTTKTVSERIIAGAIDPNHTNGLVLADDFDRALDMALHEVTKLDRDTSVLNSTVGQVEIRTKPESAV